MGPAAKKRRRQHMQYDEVTEIPKDTYQAYVNDRSSITRKQLVDYTVFLPHYSPLMPSLTTTFTDMCPSLANTLLRGAEVAEKRRQLMAEVEHAAFGGPIPLAAQDAALQAAAGPSPSAQGRQSPWFHLCLV